MSFWGARALWKYALVMISMLISSRDIFFALFKSVRITSRANDRGDTCRTSWELRKPSLIPLLTTPPIWLASRRLQSRNISQINDSALVKWRYPWGCSHCMVDHALHYKATKVLVYRLRAVLGPRRRRLGRSCAGRGRAGRGRLGQGCVGWGPDGAVDARTGPLRLGGCWMHVRQCRVRSVW